MADGHRGIPVHDGLQKLLSKLRNNHTSLKRLILNAANAIAEQGGNSPPTERNVFKLVDRWLKGLKSQSVYVHEKQRYLLGRVFEEIAPGEENPFETQPSASADPQAKAQQTTAIRSGRGRTLAALFMEYVEDDDFEADVEGAVSISLLGSNMRRIVGLGRTDILRKFLNKSSQKTNNPAAHDKSSVKENDPPALRILMLDPKADMQVLEASCIQDYGYLGEIDGYRDLIETNLSVFCGLREEYGASKVRIKLTTYMPAAGLDVIQQRNVGIVYVDTTQFPIGMRIIRTNR